MKLEILHLIEGARQARGLTVIIDVFRAFSVACYLFDNGAQRIIPVGKLEDAYRLQEKNPDYILIGERENKIQEGFDYGNSPSEIIEKDFTGKTIVHTTSAGTQGLVNAREAQEIITGSFVNAEAVTGYIRSRQPEQVSLVCMGDSGVEPADEDIFCAHYIKNNLENKRSDFNEIVNKLKAGSGRRFFDEDKDGSPRKDFDLCLNLNRFNFILKAEHFRDEHLVLQKISV